MSSSKTFLCAVLWLAACDPASADLVPPEHETAEGEDAQRDPEPPAGPGIDVLFVIDDSPGMASRQERLAADVALLVEPLEGLELHVGVTATTAGIGCGGFGELISDSCYSEGNFARGSEVFDGRTLACAVSVGDEGSPAGDAVQAMQHALLPAAFCNWGFPRPEVPLAVVILTDGSDNEGEPEDWRDELVAMRDDSVPIFVASFVGDEAPDIVAFTKLFGDRGFVADLDEPYADTLAAVGGALRSTYD